MKTLFFERGSPFAFLASEKLLLGEIFLSSGSPPAAFLITASLQSIVIRSWQSLVFAGECKWFDNAKGFGFITPEKENGITAEDVFVYQV